MLHKYQGRFYRSTTSVTWLLAANKVNICIWCPEGKTSSLTRGSCILAEPFQITYLLNLKIFRRLILKIPTWKMFHPPFSAANSSVCLEVWYLSLVNEKCNLPPCLEVFFRLWWMAWRTRDLANLFWGALRPLDRPSSCTTNRVTVICHFLFHWYDSIWPWNQPDYV